MIDLLQQRTVTERMPDFAGVAVTSFCKASNLPAEAPMAAIGKLA